LVICYLWARDLYGRGAGLAAATLWTFSPAILANGGLITPDIPAASMAVTTLYAFRLYQRESNIRHAVIAGVCLGVAQLTKMTLLLLYPILAAATVIDCWQQTVRNLRRPVQDGLICAAVSLVVLNAGYLFEGTGRPLGDHAFYSETLGGPREDWNSPGNRFAGIWLGHIPVPLPAAYLTGLDLQKRDFEGHWRPMYSYIRGHQQLGGWWYYYLYCLLVKVPVGTWLIAMAFAISLGTIATNRRRREAWLLWIAPVVLFVFVSSQTGFSRYYRYVLPCAPFVMISLSRVFLPLVRQKKQWLTQLAAVGLILMTAESLWVYPHSLAFFNLPSGGPTAGHFHLLDSNVDWGQDLYELRDWINQNSEKRPLFVAYSGVFDPHVMGIDTARPPEKVDEKPPELPPGWYAISVNHLHGYDDPNGPFTYFLNRVPVDRAGYSILIYHVAEPAP
jgi:4-amino-4-deoxy-L-arabinose transferase-like glycosyltransferase